MPVLGALLIALIVNTTVSIVKSTEYQKEKEKQEKEIVLKGENKTVAENKQ